MKYEQLQHMNNYSKRSDLIQINSIRAHKNLFFILHPISHKVTIRGLSSNENHFQCTKNTLKTQKKAIHPVYKVT